MNRKYYFIILAFVIASIIGISFYIIHLSFARTEKEKAEEAARNEQWSGSRELANNVPLKCK